MKYAASFFPAITKLIKKIGQEYVNYCNNEGQYSYDDIYSLFAKMESTLEDVVKRLEEQMTYENIDNEYPYLFPEISELYNYWIFRIKALQNKGARQILHNLNYYFSKKMYKEVVDFKIDENNQKNPKLLNKIGIAQKNLKNYSDAIKTYQKIWKSERNEKALFNLGLAYQEYAYHESTKYSENIGKAEEYF